ncbi:MAG: HAMP domain-containing histidine kinase [Oscillospiraceae bacterium]|jgi:signal transduction histidine kinase|nr:HAMP domain-containing histidine kinase [Oscillospiraceae bacterium]
MKTKSLRFKISLYISVLSVLVLALLWVLQFVLLRPFQESMAVESLEHMGKRIVRDVKKSSTLDALGNYAFEHDLRIYLIGEDGRLVGMYDGMGATMPFFRLKFPPDEFTTIEEKFAQSKSESITYVASEERIILNNGEEERAQKAVFVAKLPDELGGGYLYLSNNIPPMSTTSAVLQQQFVIISFVVLALGLIAAQLIAKMLSKPLVTLTGAAGKLAHGDFGSDFTKGTGGFAETEQLARTLGYAAGELSRLEQYRKDLIANISHDLKTPLTVIRMSGELIRDVNGEDRAARTKHCDTILREADWLSGMVGEVLELSRLQDGSAANKPEEVDISALLRAVLASFKTLEESGQCVFYPEIEDDLTVVGDAAGLRRVLVNLIGNAVNHTGADKTVGLCLRREPEGIYFAVRDTGEGIAPEDLPNIWARYYKSGKTHKRAVTGTGLGLAICRELLERHGARYGVQSEVDKGSTFWVLF